MAARAAVCAAAAAPEAVAGLVLIGPVVPDTMPRWQWTAMFSLLFSRPWGVAAWSSYYASLFPTAKPADFAGYTASQGSNLREPGRLEALQAMMLASKQASEDALDPVKTPRLVIMGTRDPDFKDAAARRAWWPTACTGTYA